MSKNKDCQICVCTSGHTCSATIAQKKRLQNDYYLLVLDSPELSQQVRGLEPTTSRSKCGYPEFTAVWLEGIKARESQNQKLLKSHLGHIWLNKHPQQPKKGPVKIKPCQQLSAGK